ncbi:MAG TPA: hypothetical protein VJS12_24495 [Steroidobacteraceae bacterium]|nr:hypothetical protein [Steroidobacteraceae bacterium]
MIVRSPWFRVSVFAALLGAASLVAAAEPPPQPRPCRELTGEERTKCEQRAREPDPARRQTPPAADEDDAPPPDTKSESDEQSDTADPPRA